MKAKPTVGSHHAKDCAYETDPRKACTCSAGKGLARRSEGFSYYSHDSTRAMARRRKQIDRQAAKGRDW